MEAHHAYHWDFSVRLTEAEDKITVTLKAEPRSCPAPTPDSYNPDDFTLFCEAVQENVVLFGETAIAQGIGIRKHIINEPCIPKLEDHQGFTIFEDVLFLGPVEDYDNVRGCIESFQSVMQQLVVDFLNLGESGAL